MVPWSFTGLDSLTFFNILDSPSSIALVIFNYTNLNKPIMKKITKGAVAEFVKKQLQTNDKWAMAALLKIYDLQTEEEKAIGDTCIYNGVGFSGAHGEIMSSFAVQYRSKGWLSPKQMKIVHKIISKYSRQIITVSDPEKLEAQVRRYQAERLKFIGQMAADTLM